MNARYVPWFTGVMWIGILVNLLFIVPLMLSPVRLLTFLGVPVVEPLIWARIAGLFLLLITVFYVPPTLDLGRHRLIAWLSIVPARAFGALFFLGAVLLFRAPTGFLFGAFVDAFFGLASLVCLLFATRPVGTAGAWGKRVLLVLGALGVFGAVLAGAGWHVLFREQPQRLADESIEEYFKYGSIGTEKQSGIPYWIWVVLPRVFPEHLPAPGGYAALGMVWEAGRETPIGFSKKIVGVERVGINCALCHTASVRRAGHDVRPMLFLAGPSHTFDALGYQRFLFKSGTDPRFTSRTILDEIDKMYRLPILERLLYRFALIPLTRKALREQRDAFAWTDSRPDWGRGRIDPFNPVKVSVLQKVRRDVVIGDTIGNSDMVPIWNMQARRGRALHWDGLNTDLREVVVSSAIGDGAVPKSLPLRRLQRLQDWLVSLPPATFPFPETIDHAAVARGESVYKEHCAGCHTTRAGQVVPLAEIGTDPHRLGMWSREAAEAYNAYSAPYPWRFSAFRATNGYVSPPLDAVWIRAPYLHNGSVPSLVDLLEPPARRPRIFYRGHDVYDPQRVGFVSTGPEAERRGFRYDTGARGNSNAGHLWGTELPPEAKRALIEYLKTL